MSDTPSDMLAMRVHAFGGPEAIVADQIPVPVPDVGEVLVKVAAASVGPWDGWIRGGTSVLPQPLPLTLGSDIAGTVIASGAGVDGFAAGLAVYGTTNPRFTDGYAQFAICKAAMIAPKPTALGFVEAASVPVIAVTAWQMLFDHAKLKAGQSVLIHGAAGNVGRFAVQIARDAGIRVLAAASPQNAAALRELGADLIVGRDLAGAEPVDAALDLVGGESQRLLFDHVKPGGALISAVSEPDAALAAAAGIRASFMLVEVRSDTLVALGRRFEANLLQTFVGEILPLDQAMRAHRMLEGALPAKPGKIVLRA